MDTATITVEMTKCEVCGEEKRPLIKHTVNVPRRTRFVCLGCVSKPFPRPKNENSGRKRLSKKVVEARAEGLGYGFCKTTPFGYVVYKLPFRTHLDRGEGWCCSNLWEVSEFLDRLPVSCE